MPEEPNVRPLKQTLTSEEEKQVEIQGLVSLLGEYTDRLRILTAERMRARVRLNINVSAFLTTGLIALFILLSSESKISITTLNISLAVLGGCVAIGTTVVASFTKTLSGFNRNSLSVVAASTERLVRLLTQYAEHSPPQVLRRVEIELRLAEAEATLSQYHKLGGVTYSDRHRHTFKEREYK